MTQTATVRRIIQKNKVELSILRESACGHDCSSCGGCSMSEQREVLVTAEDPFGARPGDTVTVESSTKKMLRIAALVYLLPVVLFFVFYLITGNFGVGEVGSGIAGAVGFAGGILLAMWYNGVEKKSASVVFTVTSIKE